MVNYVEISVIESVVINAIETNGDTVIVESANQVEIIETGVGIKGDDGREIELRRGTTHIQWKYVTDTEWTDLISLAEMIGDDGNDGLQVEMQSNGTFIQWRYVGAPSWTNLVALADLKGDQGDPGTTDYNELENLPNLALKADLGLDGKVLPSQMPDIAISHYLGLFANTTTALATATVYTSEEGDWFKTSANGGENWIVITDNPTTVSHIVKLADSTYTDEMAQDAIGVMINSTLSYNDATPSFGINLANANTWTNSITSRRDSLGLTSNDAFVADNQTAATAGLMQVSPRFRRRGRGFYSNSSTSYAIDVIDHVVGSLGIVGAGVYKIQWGINNANYQDAFGIDFNVGGKGVIFTPPAGLSNSSPGTTRNATFENPGANSYLDFNFGGVRKVSLGFTNSGEFQVWSKGGNHNGYYDDSGLYAYLYRTALVHSSGHGSFNQGINAGSSSNSAPPSKLTSHGGEGSTGVYITQNTQLDDSYHVVVVNGDNTFQCTGTPTYSCGYWTDEGSCLTRNAHGNCSWSTQDCSAWNGGGQSPCESHSGCSYQTSSCNGPSTDYDCTNQNSSYGGSCSWDTSYSSCSGLDYGSCSMTGGCSVNYGYCTNNFVAPCSWDGMTCNGGGACDAFFDEGSCTAFQIWSSCSGGGDCGSQGDQSACTSYSYYTECTGEYASGNTCNGTFFTGNCIGSSGVCSGTSNCFGIESANCASEPGCSSGFGVTLTFPSDSAYSTGFKRGYKIVNVGETRATTVVPYPGSYQTVNRASSFSVPAQETYQFDFVWFQRSCTDFTTSGACASPCSWITCSSYNGDPDGCAMYSCSYDYENSTCNGGFYCAGSYTPLHDWVVTGHAAF